MHKYERNPKGRRIKKHSGPPCFYTIPKLSSKTGILYTCSRRKGLDHGRLGQGYLTGVITKTMYALFFDVAPNYIVEGGLAYIIPRDKLSHLPFLVIGRIDI